MAVLLSAHEMNAAPAGDGPRSSTWPAAGRPAGTTEEVVRPDVLSALYGYHVDVLNVHGRVIVVAGPGSEAAAVLPVDPSREIELSHGLALRARLLLQRTRCTSRWSIGGVVAVVSAVVGMFTVLRGQSFAGHSLADVSTAGGSGSLLLGLSPLTGFLGGGVLGALGHGPHRRPAGAGPRRRHRDRARGRHRSRRAVPLPRHDDAARSPAPPSRSSSAPSSASIPRRCPSSWSAACWRSG